MYSCTQCHSFFVQAKQMVAEKLTMLQGIVKKSLLAGIPPSTSHDIWSTQQANAFMSFTIHSIDEKFKLHVRGLGSTPFDGAHTADNIGNKLREMMMKTLNT